MRMFSGKAKRTGKSAILVLFAALTLALLSPQILPAGNGVTSVEAASVKISKKKLTLVKGKSTTLKVTGTKAKVKWSSSKKSVATVTSKGKVKAKKKGTATITAKVGSKKYTCKVTVEAPKISSSKLTLDLKGSYTLKISGTKQKATWKSSDTSVATVNSKGKVTAKAAGTATITATVGGKKYKCVVTVAGVAANIERLKNQILASGKTNSDGNPYIEWSKDTAACEVIYEAVQNRIQFVYREYGGSAELWTMLMDLDISENGVFSTENALTYIDRLGAYVEGTATFNVAEYDYLEDKVQFQITAKSGELSGNEQSYANDILQLSFAWWRICLKETAGMSLSDIGIGG